MFPRDGEDVGALLRHSDTAMYQAKDRGRNNFQVFSPVMDRQLKERVAIEESLRAALESQNQLDVHYQPLIDIETRRVVTLEALVRWKHPSEGYVSPTRFIPIAEETGLIAGARRLRDQAGHRRHAPVAQGRQHGAGAGRDQCLARPAGPLRPAPADRRINTS